MLPDRVELADVRAGRQEQPRDALLVGERDGRSGSGRERRAAAGDEDQDEVVGAGRLGEEANLPRGFRSALVGHRMARLHQPDAAGRRHVAVLDRDQSVDDPVAPDLLHSRGHGAGGLARADHQHPSLLRRHDAGEGADDQGADVARGEGGVEDGARGLPEGQRRSFWSRLPASMSMSSVFGKQKRILVRPRSFVE